MPRPGYSTCFARENATCEWVFAPLVRILLHRIGMDFAMRDLG